jgi:hypothetical protein
MMYPQRVLKKWAEARGNEGTIDNAIAGVGMAELVEVVPCSNRYAVTLTNYPKR